MLEYTFCKPGYGVHGFLERARDGDEHLIDGRNAVIDADYDAREIGVGENRDRNREREVGADERKSRDQEQHGPR